jgi:hypothetical protein
VFLTHLSLPANAEKACTPQPEKHSGDPNASDSLAASFTEEAS